MKPIQHTILLLAAIALAFTWLQVAAIQQYALQVFALMVASFLIIKRLKGAQLWHVLPEHKSAEMGILTFAFLLLIGATGNTESIFYPLAYLHVFFIVMTAHPITAIISTTGLMLFHYAMSPTLNLGLLQELITLLLMLGIFLFAKQQYDQGKTAKERLKIEEKELELATDKETVLEDFTNEFLAPRVHQLRKLSQDPDENAASIVSQLDLIESELQKVRSVLPRAESTQEATSSSDAKITE